MRRNYLIAILVGALLFALAAIHLPASVRASSPAAVTNTPTNTPVTPTLTPTSVTTTPTNTPPPPPPPPPDSTPTPILTPILPIAGNGDPAGTSGGTGWVLIGLAVLLISLARLAQTRQRPV